ncbi:MAG: DUF4082 domain-containing protein [Lewinellaceae bacterium]|nr:DUF4082 domain-containing protein [Lewinellaceae bacterium]
MKYFLSLLSMLLLCLISAELAAQNELQVKAPNGNVLLEVREEGVIVKKVTTAERTGFSLTTTDKGLLVYDADLSAFFTWNGTQWKQIDGPDMADADKDTKIQVEKNTDEDMIRFDAAGDEQLLVAPGQVSVHSDFKAGRTYTGPVTLNASIYGTGFVVSSSTEPDWQSFTATAAGKVHSLQLTFGGPSQTYTISLYEGEGVGGNLLTTKSFTSPGGNTSMQISISDEIILAPGAKYTVGFSSRQDIGYYFNVSPDGRAGSNPNADYFVRVYTYGEKYGVNVVDGTLNINEAYTLPTTAGANGQTLTSNGSGNVSWTTPTDNDQQNLTLNGNNLSISNGNSVSLPVNNDNDPTNEIQVISYDDVTKILTLSNGGTVDLSGLDPATAQAAIDAHIAADLDTDPTNEIQAISYNAVTKILTLSNGGTVDLSGLDPAATQAAIDAHIDADGDLDPTNEIQAISYDAGTKILTLSNGGTVDLSDLDPATAQAAIDAHIAADLDTDPTNEIELPAGGSNGQVLTTNGSNGVSWANIPATSILRDADNDTKIQVEKNPDEDIIRFQVAGTEAANIIRNTIQGTIQTGNDSYGPVDPFQSGWQSFTATADAAIKSIEIRCNFDNLPGGFTTKSIRIYEGEGTGGSLLASLGTFTLANGWNQITVSAPINMSSGAKYTIWFSNISGICYGQSGYAGGSSSYVQGYDWSTRVNWAYYQGQFTTSSFAIENAYALPTTDGANGQVLTTDGSGTTSWYTPIGSQDLSLSGNTLSISNGNSVLLPISNDDDPTNEIELPAGGSNGQVLTTDGNNGVSWADLSIANTLTDADNDTKIQVEKNPDEDIIRFEVAGTDAAQISTVFLFDGTIQTATGGGTYCCGTTPSWQSFTATVDGLIQSIEIRYNIYSEFPTKNFAIYEGEGTGGALLASLGSHTLSHGWNQITLPTPVDLSSGAKYTIWFSTDAGIYYSTDNPYGGGRSSLNAIADFSTRVNLGVYKGQLTTSSLVIENAYALPTTDGANGQVLTTNGSGAVSWADHPWADSGGNTYRINGNVGIGTTTPTTKLDVNGTTKTSALQVGDNGTVVSQMRTGSFTVGPHHFNGTPLVYLVQGISFGGTFSAPPKVFCQLRGETGQLNLDT